MRSCNTIAIWASLLPALLLATPATAQSGGDSPFSAYGLGEVVGNTQVPQLLMGGVSVATTDPAGISTFNPASYCSLQKASFEMGFVGHLTQLRTDAATQDRANTRLLGFTLGIPWNNGRWALALGLLPVTTVGYNVTTEGELSNGVDFRHTYVGTGGLNRAFAGLAHTLWRAKPDSTGHARGQLTFGANINGLFGTVEQTRKALYPASAGYTNLLTYQGLVIRGTSVNLGLHFGGQLVPMSTMLRKRRVREEQRKAELEAWRKAHPGEEPADQRPVRMPEAPWRYTIGLCGELTSDLDARRDLEELSFVLSNGLEAIRDTNRYEQGREGILYIPPSYGIGLQVSNERWNLLADVRQRDWSQLRLDVDGYSLPSQLRPSMSVQAGASFRPARERDREFLKRVVYRLGVRYTTDYLKVGDLQLDETAISGGFSLPISEGAYLARLNLGVVCGQRGNEAAGVQERFANIQFGFTLTPNKRERWFAPYRIE
ncbi:MAG: hypothetical protein JNL05_09450 [Flavobacteriales bacterium]|nr:hypothetical protein [Flavobacteriales bacterium]